MRKHNLTLRESASLFNDRLKLDANANLMVQTIKNSPTSGGIYLNPLVTMVASVIILHEKITWITLLGAGCIIFGVYQAEKKCKSKICI